MAKTKDGKNSCGADSCNDSSDAKIIGHGTWLDKLAHELVCREESLGRDTGMLVVESGLGASGIPHVGSLGDAVRAYGVKLALENLGYDSKLIAYSDDLDGLRKIPDGMPDSLEEHLAKPVSLIPDPYSCCDSYGMHMSSILLDGLDRVGVEYDFRRAYDTYKSGLLKPYIHTILLNSSPIGQQIDSMVGQSKYNEGTLPYFPVCASCNRLYTAQATEYHPDEYRVSYVCRDTQMNKRAVRGCGYTGECSIASDLGKLAWKVEFAARWAAFGVRFEAYGKDIMDSVRVNDWVAESILGYAPPTHAKYEMFLDKGGKKISKSAGNVLTAQRWLEFGTPQSILLLLYKRITGAREIDIKKDIPSLVDEFNELESIYFDSQNGRLARYKDLKENPAKLARMRGLYLYCNLLQPPDSPGAHVGYMLAAKLAAIYKKDDDRQRRVIEKLIEYGTIKESSRDVEMLVDLAGRYADEFESAPSDDTDAKLDLDDASRRVLLEIAGMLDSADSSDAIQTGIYEAAKSCGLRPRDVFATIYVIILGSRAGPRIGPLIYDMGAAQVARIIRERVE